MENTIFKQKLIYNDIADTTSIQNILLICSKVVESQLFLDSVNTNTFGIIYSPSSDKNELIELLRNKFKNGIKRASFAFHDPLNQNVYFLDNKLFFDENDLIDNQTIFSENVTFLTNLIKEFNIENCDFLACNSLQYNNWKKYYELLNKITNVICGASNNNTGNLQYGSDWIMENTNENVRDIYFTNLINNYTSSLVTFTINNVIYSTSGSNASVTGFSSPPSNWNLTIPSTVINGSTTYNVTSINIWAFAGCTNLSSITIPNSVTSIGDGAFYFCTSLSSITIPNSVTSIGNSAFSNCTSLLNVYFMGNIPTIGFDNFTAGSDTAYYITGATAPNNTTPVTYLTMFTTKTIGTIPTIGSWYATGIQKAPTDPSFDLTNPESNSQGTFTYTSSNTNVATISNNIVTIVGIGTSTITALQNYNSNYFSNSVNTILTVQTSAPIISNICFVGSTPITTNQGNISIDKINPQIHTIRNKKILRITQTKTQDTNLVCFEKDSLGSNIPSQKTIISNNHCIYYQGKIMKAKDFIGKYENVKNVRYMGEILYNVLMEDHDKMLVNNLICETLHPKNPIVEIYNLLEKMNPKDQELFIKENNKYVIDNKILNFHN